jgi:hypothetical protein
MPPTNGASTSPVRSPRPAPRPLRPAPVAVGAPGAPRPGWRLLENHERLSRSVIWKQLEGYYQSATLQTWSRGDGAVPCYVTCNAVIADVYAELVQSALLDMYDQLDGGEPIYIVELAAGSGMFGHHMVRALEQRLRAFSRLASLDVRYVMTDFTETTVAAWDEVDSLRPYRESGKLDTAIFWPERDDAIRLRFSGGVLDPSTVQNPVFVIANYLFDSVPADCFRTLGGNLHEIRYAVYEDTTVTNSPQHPFARMRTDIECRRVNGDYYGEANRDAILAEYAAEFPDTTFSVPVSALAMVDRMHALSRGRWVLLSSDKGYVSPATLGHVMKLDFAEHGSISFSVNYDAIVRYAARHGATSFSTSREYASLQTIATAFAPGRGSTSEIGLERTRETFRARILETDTLNAVSRMQGPFIAACGTPSTPHQCEEAFAAGLAFVRAMRFDPWAFASCAPMFQQVVERLPEICRPDVQDLLAHVESAVYPGLRSSAETLLVISLLYAQGGWFSPALQTALRARKTLGETEGSLLALGTAYEACRMYEDAAAAFEQLRATLPQQDIMGESELAQQANLTARIAKLRQLAREALVDKRVA